MRTEDNILENVIRLQGQEANAAERDLRGECIAPAAIPPNIRNGPDYGLGRTRRSLQLRQLLIIFNNEPHFVAKHRGVLNVPLHVREVSKPAHDRACTNQSTVWMDDG